MVVKNIRKSLAEIMTVLLIIGMLPVSPGRSVSYAGIMSKTASASDVLEDPAISGTDSDALEDGMVANPKNGTSSDAVPDNANGTSLDASVFSIAPLSGTTEYNVTFVTDNGSNVDSITAADGTLITKPEDPTKKGYTFYGWYKDQGLTEAWNFFTDKIPARNINLYAKWMANEYTVRFNANGGSGTMGDLHQVYDMDFKLTPNGFTAPAGTSFYGWSRSQEGADKQTIDYQDQKLVNNMTGEANGVVILYAVWKENDSVKISYISSDPNLGNVTSPEEYVYPVSGKASGSTAQAYNGYSFVSWTDASENVVSTEAAFVPQKNASSIYVAATYQANFAVANYTITYDLAGGTATGNNPASYTVKSENFTLSNPTRAGYNFRGWTGTGIQGYSTSVTISKGSTGNRAYTAVWEAITYDITYKPGDHGAMTNSAGNPLTGNTVSGTFDQLTPAPDATLTAQAGYTFAGWKADEAGPVYTNAQLAALRVTGSATYTAQWTANTDTAYTVNCIRVKSDGFSGPITETIRKTGITGSYVDANALAAEKSYAGYAYDSTKNLFTDTAHPQGSYDPLPIAGDGSLAVDLYYVEGANVRLGFAPDDASRGSVDWPQMYKAPATGEATAVTATASAGYTFAKWTYTDAAHTTATDVPGATSATITAAQIDSVAKDTGAYEATAFTAVFTEISAYTVQHCKVNADGTSVSRVDTESLTGTTNTLTSAEAKSYEGYTYRQNYNQNGMKTVASGIISADGTLVLKLYYTPDTGKKYTVNYIRLQHGGTARIGIETDTNMTGTTDATINVASIAAGKMYAGYAFDSARTTYADSAHAESQASLPIAANGTTVVNLYYVEGASVMLTFTPDDSSHGSVETASEELAPATGQATAVTATARAGYTFVKWTYTNADHTAATDVEGATSATITKEQIDSIARTSGIYAAASFTANFEIIRLEVTATVSSAGGGTVSNGMAGSSVATVDYGSGLTLKATPDLGYEFVKWQKNGNDISDKAELLLSNINESAVYTAIFQKQVFTVTAAASPEEGGTVTGAGSFGYGEQVRVKAEPNAGYHFVSWTENGTQVSTDAEYFFTAANRSLTGVFLKNFIPVTAIENVPDTLTAGTKLTLRGSVLPYTATNQELVWTISNDGGTGATLKNSRVLKTASAGILTLEARVSRGLSETEDYVTTFTVIVNPASGTLLDNLQEGDTLTEGQKIDFASISDAVGRDAEFDYFDMQLADKGATASSAVMRDPIKAGVTYAIKSWNDALRKISYTIWHIFKITVDENTGFRNIFLMHNPIRTVTFDADGGTCGVGAMYTDENGNLNALPDPYKDGNTFTGWYDSRNSGNKISKSTLFETDATLYAHWIKNTVNTGNSGSGSNGTAPTRNSGKDGNASGTWTKVAAQEGTKWQFRKTDGTVVKDTWMKTDNEWHHFDSNGYAQTGWVLDQGKWYHCDPKSCAMDTGTYNDPKDGQIYYLNTDGSMATGWVTINGKQYYFNPNPVAATYTYDTVTQTWVWNGNGTLPYGAMLKNTITPDGHKVDETGARID